ncbi:MAG: helical backbone metal receptor [Vicinamibacterales bacterium]
MAARTKGLVLPVLLLGLAAASLVRVAADADIQRSAPRAPTTSTQRIASLVPALTEMLFAIGAGSQLVAVSSYDTFPPEVRALPKVGALLNPDYERILSLAPTLVITYGSQTDLEARFARAGIRVYSYRHGGLDKVFQTLRELGALTGHQSEADIAVRDLQTQLDVVRDRVRGRPRPRTLLVFERDPQALRQVYASAGNGFLHDILEIAGSRNVFGDVAGESVQPSTEALLVRAPEVIIEVRGGEPPAAGVLLRERAVWAPLASIPAVRNNRVHFLYGDYLVVPGTRLGRTADALARLLHPEAYR